MEIGVATQACRRRRVDDAQGIKEPLATGVFGPPITAGANGQISRRPVDAPVDAKSTRGDEQK